MKIGTIEHIEGNITAEINGVKLTPQIGDSVHLNTLIETGFGSIVIRFEDGSRFDLGRNSTAFLDYEVYTKNVEDLAAQSVIPNDLIAALEAGVDPSEIFEATAAGGDRNPDGEVQDPVVITRTGAEGEVTAGFDTSTQGYDIIQTDAGIGIVPKNIIDDEPGEDDGNDNDSPEPNGGGDDNDNPSNDQPNNPDQPDSPIRPNAGAGNGGEGGDTEQDPDDVDPGNSGDNNNAPDTPPGLDHDDVIDEDEDDLDDILPPGQAKEHKDNGFGNGDDDAPGGSEFNNNAENAGGNGNNPGPGNSPHQFVPDIEEPPIV